ncbi:twinkle protein, mitochondrial [Aphidius gifuensis]|uniref:twinkle protein, mitochondrial n=1 Tax=Aphidius gifuensis TaxID=684658 RepID=UPI001CDB994D|nr:twinkle protein, mitochondrial [Aphidius gifuensis]
MFVKTVLRCWLTNQKSLKPIYWQKNRTFHSELDLSVSSTSLGHIKKILRQQNVTFQEGHSCLLFRCPICDDNKKKELTVFVNKTTGFFLCQQCEHSGSWDILERFFDKKSTTKIQELNNLKKTLSIEKDYSDKWDKICKSCQAVSKLSENDYHSLIEKFQLPTSITQSQLSQLNSEYDLSTSKLYFPLRSLSNKITGCKTLSLKSSSIIESSLPSINPTGLIIYREKKLKNDTTGVLVPSVEDLLALISQKVANTIICLPQGLQNLPIQVLPNLELFNKLILWFDNDAISWDSARHYAKKLNEKRCYFVRPTNQQPRPKIAVARELNLKSIIQDAQPIYHKSVTTFSSLRKDVLSDLQNVDKVQGVKWTRYPTLNKLLKGHRRGEFTIVTGPTGSGKTTFMSEYSLDLAMQGVNTLWGSFEIRNTRLAKTMLQQMCGVQLEDNLHNFELYADEFEKLPIYFMTFHGQQTLSVVMDAVQHATYVHDISHVIIDNVQFMMGMSEQSKHLDRYYRQDVIISEFRSFATKTNCHVTLVIHPRKERAEDDLTSSSIFGGAKASQEADNILIIQDKRTASLKGKKYLQVTKNRYSGDLGVMPLDFDRTSLSYQQKKKPKPEESLKNIKQSDEDGN